MEKSIKHIVMATAAMLLTVTFTSCEKVSPQGVLMANTSVDDRVKQSLVYYLVIDERLDKTLPEDVESYSFLVGSDSHITIDPGRLSEMLEIGLEHDDLFYCHLGDLADTKAEYYFNTDLALNYFFYEKWQEKYIKPYVDPTIGITEDMEYYIDERTGQWGKFEDFRIPFFPVVGNHDITHNGWALFNSIFKTSFYEFTVKIGESYDRFIFLDSANGTLGKYQIESIENNTLLHDDKEIRNTFVFTHTNIFRPKFTEFASTYCREELYYLLDKMNDWNTTIMFCGHVHAWDDRMFGGVRYITMPSMNFVDHPNGGDDLLVRITVNKNGSYEMERVGLYSKERSKSELEYDGYYTSTK